MIKYLIGALTFALLACTGVQAAPSVAALSVTPAVQHGSNADLLVDVKYNKKKWKHRHYKHHKRYKHDRYYHDRYYRYNRDRHYRYHYRRPPPGWRRYDRRPYGYSRRGCIAIGPVWYCP